jgi:hypothetical protein
MLGKRSCCAAQTPADGTENSSDPFLLSLRFRFNMLCLYRDVSYHLLSEQEQTYAMHLPCMFYGAGPRQKHRRSQLLHELPKSLPHSARKADSPLDFGRRDVSDGERANDVLALAVGPYEEEICNWLAFLAISTMLARLIWDCASAILEPWPGILRARREKRVTGTICRNGPRGASHKWCLSPFFRDACGRDTRRSSSLTGPHTP